MDVSLKNATTNEQLILYAELNNAEIRAAQRRLKEGALQRIVPGLLTAHPQEEWASYVYCIGNSSVY